MNRTAVVFGLLVVAGCSREENDSTPECTVVLDDTLPVADSTDAYYRAAIEATFEAADPSATITLLDAQGAEVPGQVSVNDDATTAYFDPSSPLTPGSAYSAEISWCDGEASQTVDFTTSSLGQPIADPSGLLGQTYVLDLGSARFVKPEGVGELLGQQLDQNILLTVVAADSSDLQMTGALSTEEGLDQDYCTPTIEFPTADFSEAPFWAVQADQTTFTVSDISIEIQDLNIAGTFSADGSYFGGGVLAGSVDTRPLVGLLDSKDPNAICQLAVSFGAVCEPCTDGEPYCLSLTVDQLVAEATTGGDPIETVLESDCHELCEASVENPECKEFYKGGK